MPSYLVEAYAAKGSFERERDLAQLAGDLGSGVRYVRSTFLPGDEAILHVFEAASIEALREAGGRAGLQYERIVEAVERPGPDT
jgi:hypothetical protein